MTTPWTLTVVSCVFACKHWWLLQCWLPLFSMGKDTREEEQTQLSWEMLSQTKSDFHQLSKSISVVSSLAINRCCETGVIYKICTTSIFILIYDAVKNVLTWFLCLQLWAGNEWQMNKKSFIMEGMQNRTWHYFWDFKINVQICRLDFTVAFPESAKSH